MKRIYQTISIVEVMPPQRSQLFLASDVPHCELNILILNFLNIKPWKLNGKSNSAKGVTLKTAHDNLAENAVATLYNTTVTSALRSEEAHYQKMKNWIQMICQATNGGNCGQNFSDMQLVENGSFPCRVQSKHHHLPDTEDTQHLIPRLNFFLYNKAILFPTTRIICFLTSTNCKILIYG